MRKISRGTDWISAFEMAAGNGPAPNAGALLPLYAAYAPDSDLFLKLEG